MLFSILLGCNDSFNERSLPQPSFQASQMFGQVSIKQSSTKKVDNDPFAALDVGKKVSVETSEIQLVSLGGIITTEIPMDAMGNAWIVSSQKNEFLITYIDPESEKTIPKVIIYGLYDTSSDEYPTFAIRRFISTVDPFLEQSGLWQAQPFLASLLSSISLQNPLSIDNFHRATNPYLPSIGLGLGYKSLQGTFSGWKWIGRNGNDVNLRIGNTKGKFIPVQDDIKLLLQNFDASSYLENPSLDILNELSDLQKSIYEQSGMPAEMFLGSVGYQNQNIFVAVMCVTQPTCKQEKAIISFFDEMRPTASTDVFGTSIYEDTTKLASFASIPLMLNSDDAFQSYEKQLNKNINQMKDGKKGVLNQILAFQESMGLKSSDDSNTEGNITTTQEGTEGQEGQEESSGTPSNTPKSQDDSGSF